MIRTLLIVAAASLFVSAVTLAAAVRIVGPNAIAQGAWSFGPGGWGGAADNRSDNDAAGVRTFPWPKGAPGAHVVVDVPADMIYRQTEGPPTLTVSGPKGLLETLVVEDGRIASSKLGEDQDRLRLTLVAPAVSRFKLESSGSLRLKDYHQDGLDVVDDGSADVRGEGATKDLRLDLSGSGDVDLSALRAEVAEVSSRGSGDVVLTPQASATVSLSGSGDVRLTTAPRRLRTERTGSGRLESPDGDGSAPSSPT